MKFQLYSIIIIKCRGKGEDREASLEYSSMNNEGREGIWNRMSHRSVQCYLGRRQDSIRLKDKCSGACQFTSVKGIHCMECGSNRAIEVLRQAIWKWLS